MAPKLHLPAAAVKRSWEEPSGECCCDNVCRGNSCFQILAAAHTTGGLLATAMLGAIVEDQHRLDPEPMRRSMGYLAQPVASFAVLPLLGTLLAKAPDFIKAIRLLGTAAFVLCLLVDLILPSLFLASDKVGDALPVCSLLLGLCDAAIKLALLCACESQVVKGNSVRLVEAFGVAYLVSLWGESLGLAMAAAPWGQNGYFTGFTSKTCPAGSNCMRMQICSLLCIPFQLLGLLMTLRLNSEKRRWRSSPQWKSRGEKVKEEEEQAVAVKGIDTDSRLEDLVEDPGTNVAFLGAVFCSIAVLCAKEQAQIFATKSKGVAHVSVGALRFILAMLGCALAPRCVKVFGGFGTWMVVALMASAMLLCSPVVTGLSEELWIATATGFFPLLFFALPCVVTLRRARARDLPVSVALALTLACQQCGFILWHLAGPLLPEHLGPWLGAVCCVWTAVLCSRAIVCDRDGQIGIQTVSTGPSSA